MQLYGNIFNRMDENRKPATPAVGMGATILMYSDRHAATIVAVGFNNSVQVQEDVSIRTDANGMSDSQSYRYEPNTKAKVRWFTLRKNGRYVERGSAMINGIVLMVGERDTYHDYGF